MSIEVTLAACWTRGQPSKPSVDTTVERHSAGALPCSCTFRTIDSNNGNYQEIPIDKTWLHQCWLFATKLVDGVTGPQEHLTGEVCRPMDEISNKHTAAEQCHPRCSNRIRETASFLHQVIFTLYASQPTQTTIRELPVITLWIVIIIYYYNYKIRNDMYYNIIYKVLIVISLRFSPYPNITFLIKNESFTK